MTLVREAFFAGLNAAAPEMPVASEAGGFTERRIVAGKTAGGSD